MLQRWKVDVVAYGPSLHDANSYYLMRGFPGVDERQRREDAFYGSEEWIKGPREAILADIDSYATIVIRVDDDTLRGLRRGQFPTKEIAMSSSTTTTAPADLAALLDLNRDYVRSVQTSDVKRFREILADDFLCSQPDGTLIDRERFLVHTARPVTIANLRAHDVEVRLMGDFAIIHARTSYTTAEGNAGAGRYTDVWARRDGRWLAVSAHVTRLP
jgi:ketosteroid isomerase-like protein